MKPRCPLWWSFFLLVLLSLSGCQLPKKSAEQLYGHFIVMDGSEWGAEEEYFFTIPVDEPKGQYRVVGVCRTTPNFSLEELGVGVLKETPAHHFSRKVITVPTDNRAETSIRGYNLVTYQFVIEEGEVFDESGVYTYSLQQLMNDEIVTNIIELGLIVERL